MRSVPGEKALAGPLFPRNIAKIPLSSAERDAVPDIGGFYPTSNGSEHKLFGSITEGIKKLPIFGTNQRLTIPRKIGIL